ncbi:MAG: helix-turn-helix domain-containing protein [Deltaproteobacteria bacterium]|nr:helix-turn-helix domain-containing protein [Deltaproteobacteria bacterium]
MESPGEYLRRERELRGASLSRIFESTRVPRRYLEALEADNYDVLPHPTFVKGYIKSYCKALGLDEVDAVLRYEIYLRDKSEKAEAERPRAPSRKRAARQAADVPKNVKNAAAFISAGIIIIVVLYFAVGRKAVTPAPQPEALSGSTEAMAPAANEPVSAGVKTEAPKEEKQPPAVAAPEAKPEAKAAKAEPGTMAPATAATAAEAQHTLSVKANEISWVKIRIDDGEPFDVVLRQGEGIVWKAKETFSLIVGNAGGVALTYDGKALPPLGKSGDVVSFKLPKTPQTNQAAQPVKPAKVKKPETPGDALKKMDVKTDGMGE